MKKIILSIMIAITLLVISNSAYAHSGRTTTNNPYGLPGHNDSSTGIWHPHF